MLSACGTFGAVLQERELDLNPVTVTASDESSALVLGTQGVGVKEGAGFCRHPENPHLQLESGHCVYDTF